MPILKYNHIDSYFDTVTSCIDEGYKKPDPTCLNRLMAQYEDDRSEFIYFGDSEVDRQFAKNSGIDFIVFDQYLNDKTLFIKLIDLFVGKNEHSQTTRKKLTIIKRQVNRLRIKSLPGTALFNIE